MQTQREWGFADVDNFIKNNIKKACFIGINILSLYYMLSNIQVNWNSKNSRVQFIKQSPITENEIDECMSYSWWRFRRTIKESEINSNRTELVIKL